MVSYHGYWQFQDLIQSYDLYDKRSYPSPEHSYSKDSIYGFLKYNGNFSIFAYILKVAKMDIIADQKQFNSTIFVCDDETLKKIYGEEFFMNLDKNSATILANYHILPYPVNEKSFLSRRISVVDTRDKKSQLTIINNKGKININNQAFIISEQIDRSNGIIYVLNDLLIPENFTV
jgi:uncharacterized surface protein with fasciclin (FAS1) repeats